MSSLPPRILDLRAEGEHGVFVSHSRRDPGALNASYALVNALREGAHPASGRPFCAATLCQGAPGDSGGVRAVLWLDKEQMGESGGEDWARILTLAQKRAALSIFLLSNAYVGSAECMKELQYADMMKFKLVPVFLQVRPLHQGGRGQGSGSQGTRPAPPQTGAGAHAWIRLARREATLFILYTNE